MSKSGRSHYGVLALVSSAQLSVGGVLHIEHPAPHQHRQPRKKQVLHPHKGEPSLRSTDTNSVLMLKIYFIQIESIQPKC